jgi:hypothetical protein
MVNKKLVFPWGCQFDHKYFEKFELLWSRADIDIYNDLDRIVCVLDGYPFEHCGTIHQALEAAFDALGHHVRAPFNNQAESQYFDIRFFKKGTVHLKWKRMDLWEQFNVTAAAGKKWLGQSKEPADKVA